VAVRLNAYIFYMLSGFLNERHRATFEAARSDHRRGGSLAETCGAKARNGGICKLPPLRGHTRCLNHAGPTAARQYRDHQLKELAAGRLDPAAFEAAEQRRAANRLKWLWKKHGPWVPGSTISLGVHEDGFAEGLEAAGHRATNLPPGIADALRWKYRRHMVDRKQPAEWGKALEGLCNRVLTAGEPPPDITSGTQWRPCFETPSALSPYSRRRILNRDRLLVEGPQKATSGKPKAAAPDVSSDLNMILIQHHADLAPVLARCHTAEDRLRVAAGYDRIIAEPAEVQARRDWMALLRGLGI
jgi:hypothetical protein